MTYQKFSSYIFLLFKNQTTEFSLGYYVPARSEADFCSEIQNFTTTIYLIPTISRVLISREKLNISTREILLIEF